MDNVAARGVGDGNGLYHWLRRAVALFANKYVFPGGAVDPNDSAIPTGPLSPRCTARLHEASHLSAEALAAAAIRELWEETGQILGRPGVWPNAPQGWRGFAETGHVPHGSALQFFFRAVTPQGRPRRFDARFFLANAADLASDPDDFSDEMSFRICTGSHLTTHANSIFPLLPKWYWPN